MKPLRFLLITLIGAVLHTICIYFTLKLYAGQTSATSLGTTGSFQEVFGAVIGTVLTSVGLYLLTLMATLFIGTVHSGMLFTALVVSLTWLKATPIALGDFLIKKDNLFLNILRMVGYLVACLAVTIMVDFSRLAKTWSWWGVAATTTTVIVCCIYINWLVAVGKKILARISRRRQQVMDSHWQDV